MTLRDALVAIDIETSPIDPITKDIEKIWCICTAWKERREIKTDSIVFPDGITKNELAVTNNEQLTHLQNILDNKLDVIPVFHNALFEYRHLTESGFRIRTFHDSQVLGYVLCPALQTFSLEAWGERGYCDRKKYADVDVKEFFSKFSNEMVERCLGDVISTLQLAEKLIELLSADPKAYNLYQELDIPFIPVLSMLNASGIHIDNERLTDFTMSIESDLEKCTNSIYDLIPAAPGKLSRRLTEHKPGVVVTGSELTSKDIGKFVYCGVEVKEDKKIGIERPYYTYRKIEKFNPGSGDQRLWALATYDGFMSKEKTATGKPTTGKYALEAALDEGSRVAEYLLEYQELGKLYSTYCTPMQNNRDKHSRLYSEFTNTVTYTGRLSSRSPNFQNIPKRSDLGKRIRNCITAPDRNSVIVSIDLSAAELRILAWYLVKLLGDNPKYPDAWLLWNAFQRGEDPHQDRMQLFNCNRLESKTLTFGTTYGMGSSKFARTLKCNIDRAKYLLKTQKLKMPSIEALKDLVWETARKREDHVIHSLYGRRFQYLDIVSEDGAKRSRAERQAFNALIQGTQGDIMKLLMIESLPFIIESGAKPIMQIHDQLVCECPIGSSEWLGSMLSQTFTRNDLLPGLPLVGEAEIGPSLGELE